MSLGNFFKDLFTGNISHAGDRFMDWWNGSASPALKHFLTETESEEGKILQDLVGTAIKDVEAGGFTTASFVTAGKDVLAQLIARNIETFTIQHVMAMLNITASPLVAAATNGGPAV